MVSFADSLLLIAEPKFWQGLLQERLFSTIPPGDWKRLNTRDLYHSLWMTISGKRSWDGSFTLKIVSTLGSTRKTDILPFMSMGDWKMSCLSISSGFGQRENWRATIKGSLQNEQ
jgi:hypothetical protein